jgi:hypothetical protein
LGFWHETFELTSECINGKRVVAKVSAAFEGMSIGAPGSYTVQNVSFVDPLS